MPVSRVKKFRTHAVTMPTKAIASNPQTPIHWSAGGHIHSLQIRFFMAYALRPNTADHQPRAAGVPHRPEPLSRGSVHPAG
jgi:hypothetical protein